MRKKSMSLGERDEERGGLRASNFPMMRGMLLKTSCSWSNVGATFRREMGNRPDFMRSTCEFRFTFFVVVLFYGL